MDFALFIAKEMNWTLKNQKQQNKFNLSLNKLLNLIKKIIPFYKKVFTTIIDFWKLQSVCCMIWACGTAKHLSRVFFFGIDFYCFFLGVFLSIDLDGI